MRVWVVCVTHRHGVNIYVTTTEDLAWDELYRYVCDNSEDELGDVPSPAGRDDAIGKYFEAVEDEFYDVDPFDVRDK